MGDFNGVPNPTKDRISINKIQTSKIETILIRNLTQQNFTDTFRELQEIKRELNELDPQELQFTRIQKESKSRIDQIWISAKTADTLLKADILDTQMEVTTDHHCARVQLLDIFRNGLPRGLYHTKAETHYNLTSANEKTWEKFLEQ